MNHYLVRLSLRIGEYEKISYSIIRAKDEYQAGDYAIYCESHCVDDLDGTDGGAYDDWGGMHYSVDRCDLIRKDELKTLKKYLYLGHYDQEDLDKSGNYKEKAND